MLSPLADGVSGSRFSRLKLGLAGRGQSDGSCAHAGTGGASSQDGIDSLFLFERSLRGSMCHGDLLDQVIFKRTGKGRKKLST